MSELRVAGRARAACFNSWRRCSRPAASPAPFGLEKAAGHRERALFPLRRICWGGGHRCHAFFNCRPGRAHPKGTLAKVSVAWGSAAWFRAGGDGGGLSLGYFFGPKGAKRKPCIERSGCPAQLRVALEGPPRKTTFCDRKSFKRISGSKRPEISGNGRSLTTARG